MTSRLLTRRTVYYIAPLIAWMLVIFLLSTDHASADNTNPVVNRLLHRIFPWLADQFTLETQSRIDFAIRKAAHVTEYAILAVLAYRAVVFGNTRFHRYHIYLPLVIGILYAVSDEYHQSFVPSRGAAVTDVFYDSFGVITGVLLCLWQRRRRCLRGANGNVAGQTAAAG